MLEKVEHLGAASTQRIAERYMAAAQHWYTQLDATVGESAWSTQSLAQQLQVARMRGEWHVYSIIEDKVTPLGVGGGRRAVSRFALPSLNAGTYTTIILEVYERRRKLRERQMTNVGCEKVCCLDFCASSGERLGGKWQALVTFYVRDSSYTMNSLYTINS